MENEIIYNYVPLWGSWQIEELLGKGSFGSVYRVSKDVYGDKIYSVVKIISIPNKDQYNSAISITGSRDNATLSKYFESLAKSIVNEINLLYTLKGSSNIISFEDHMIEKKSNNLGWDILIRMEQATSLTEYLSTNTLQKKDIIQFGIDIC
ncbi:MAG: serine/threonine protein kinase, partial [Clostridiales bacterium]